MMVRSAAERISRILETTRIDGADRSPELIGILYDELRGLARSQLARLRPGHTLQPTALVHEAYLRLMQGESATWHDRSYFFAAASRAMWRILVEECRRKASIKRGGDQERLPLDAIELELEGGEQGGFDDVLAIDEALQELGPESRETQVVLLRYFVGMSMEEIGEALGVSSRTVERDWRFARAFLRRALSAERD